ncbi:MAG TPA: radical SAM protein [Bacteroidales bacterium]|nr:radical SAM protein [Bacteroidales bacterium]
MKTCDVVFIAHEEYNNLGVGYLCSLLRKEGYSTAILDCEKSRDHILRMLRLRNPVIVGFSIISYGYLSLFKELAEFLREQGITSHFTAGGHYPSLNPEELFGHIPALDSIVRFEGEYVMLDLVRAVKSGADWKYIDGLAYIDSGAFITNPFHALVKDIDEFPFPVRTRLRKFFYGMPVATILAGRGCMNSCTFCNTSVFYSLPGGPLKRIRKPANVVAEMKDLYRTRKCSIFMFTDDDFPVKQASYESWIEDFCSELKWNNLENKLLWKICCRPDEVQPDSFLLMKKNGLFLVFLGIEDGCDETLKILRKNTTVSQITQSIRLLKRMKIGIDYGFMLFQPSTTFDSLNKNLDFLREMCGDGYLPAAFLKMIPLYRTKIEKDLIAEGRLKRGLVPDYDFYENEMNCYYDFVMKCFCEWQSHPYGMLNISKWLRNYYLLYARLIADDTLLREEESRFRKIVRSGNHFIIGKMKELASVFESGEYHDNPGLLDDFFEDITARHAYFRKKINEQSDKLFYMTLTKAVRSYSIPPSPASSPYSSR